MSKCVPIRRKHRKICVGDLDTLISITDRDIIEPIFGNVDFDESFSNATDTWAMVETFSGEAVWNGVNTDENITHKIYVHYDASITAEKWVVMDGRRIDILRVEDLDNRHEWTKLTCVARGDDAKEANKA